MAGDTNVNDTIITLPNNSVNDDFFQKTLRVIENEGVKIKFKYFEVAENDTINQDVYGITKSFDGGVTYQITFGPYLLDLPYYVQVTTIIHELIHVLLLNDLNNYNYQNGEKLIIWQVDGTASISNLAESICDNNQFTNLNNYENYAFTICKHLDKFGYIDANGQYVSSSQWMHTLFTFGEFNAQILSDNLTNYIKDNVLDNEYTLWKSTMLYNYGTNWKGVVSRITVNSSLRKTEFFNQWRSYSMQDFNRYIEEMENGYKINHNIDTQVLETNPPRHDCN